MRTIRLRGIVELALLVVLVIAAVNVVKRLQDRGIVRKDLRPKASPALSSYQHRMNETQRMLKDFSGPAYH
jgi:hypothetical protein